jgi:hypothetical protein
VNVVAFTLGCRCSETSTSSPRQRINDFICAIGNTPVTRWVQVRMPAPVDADTMSNRLVGVLPGHGIHPLDSVALSAGHAHFDRPSLIGRGKAANENSSRLA